MSGLFTQSEAGQEAMRADAFMRCIWEDNGLRSQVVAREVHRSVYGEALHVDGTVQYYVEAFRVSREALLGSALRELSYAAAQHFFEPEFSSEAFHAPDLRVYKELVTQEAAESTGVLWSDIRNMQPAIAQLSDELMVLLNRVRGVQAGNAKIIGQLLIGSGSIADMVLREGYDVYTQREGKMFFSQVSEVFAIIRRSLEQVLILATLKRSENDNLEQGLYHELHVFSGRKLRAPTGTLGERKVLHSQGENGPTWKLQRLSQTADMAKATEEMVQGLQRDAAVQVRVWLQSMQMPELNAFAGNGEFTVGQADRPYVQPWGRMQYGFRRNGHGAFISTTSQSPVRQLRLRTEQGKFGEFVLTDERVAADGSTLLAPLPEADVSNLRRADASLHRGLEMFWIQHPDIVDVASRAQPLTVIEVPEGTAVFLSEQGASLLTAPRRKQLISAEQVQAMGLRFSTGTSECLFLPVASVDNSLPQERAPELSIEQRLREIMNRRGHLQTSVLLHLLEEMGVEHDTGRGKGSHESLAYKGERSNVTSAMNQATHSLSPQSVIRMLKELSVPLALFYNVLRVHYKE